MNDNLLANILKVFSVLSFVIMDVLIKKLSDNFPTNEIIFVDVFSAWYLQLLWCTGLILQLRLLKLIYTFIEL